MIRFHVKTDDEVLSTSWQEEVLGDLSRQTAAQKVSELRREHPEGIISVERSSVIPRKKSQVVRFKIQYRNNDTYYSAVFPIEQKDIKLAEIQKKHPKATITSEERDV